jgi:amino acid transporter
MVSGGAYGLEELVACGYETAVLALVVTPVVWSLPAALMVGELASAVPQEGGYYAWVRRALGPFWGFQEAWLSLVASVFDMAVYPTIFTLYLGRLFPGLGPGTSLAAGVLLVVGCAAWNLRGASGVGSGSAVLSVALLGPFVAYVVLAFLHAALPAARANVHSAAAPDAHTLFAGVMVAMWNYMGWDNASTVAGEVEDPQRNYPRAMLMAAALVAFTYLVPVAAAAVAGIDPSAWSTGAWAPVAGALAGRWLELAVVAGGMICGLGMTTALVLSYTRVPYAMALDGMLPRVLARVHPKTGAPWVAIVVCATAWCLCLPLGFEKLILIDIMLYGGSLLLEFVALVVLRVREPGLPRPFRAPGGTLGAALLGAGPAALIAVAVIRAYGETAGPVNALGFGLGIAAAGVAAYWLFLRKRHASAAGKEA